MDTQTLAYYETQAGAAGDRYRTVAGGVSDWFAESFAGYAKILDVGCGAGRDLCRLLEQGHDATGADASRAMLEVAIETCRRNGFVPEGRLIEDGLPDLASFADGRFDGVVCSAVLMHLPEERLFDSVYGLRRVLRPGGRLLLSIPEQRPDIDPVTRRDSAGRYFADLPPAKLKLLLERVGFRLLWERVTDDSLGRPGHSWATFLFERLAEDAERPLDQVESILNRDKKDATYKLALFRALADIAQSQYNIAEFVLPGRVGIPLHALAERWLIYYWPFVASDTFIPQKYGEKPGSSKPVAIRSPLEALIRAYGEGGGLPAFRVALKNGKLPEPVRQAYQDAIRKIGSTIWNMPVRYAGGGDDFSVFGYDRATRHVTMPESLWRELTLTGSWILDATVLRWAELTERLSRGSVSVGLAIEKLLAITDPERETRDARQLFTRMGVTECVWSERPITAVAFEVDHVIPFALWHNNDLWNLLPAHPSVNNQKRDLLPTQRLLRRRRGPIIGYWEALRADHPERFDRESSALCGFLHSRRQDWQTTLFTCLAEAVEITAVQRRVPRWEPATQARRRAVRTPPPRPEPVSSPRTYGFAEIRDGAFRDYLPLIGSLAAGLPYLGIDIASFDEVSECDWLEVPRRLTGRNRFVIRINGDSMEPELHVNDLVVFEYHRSPRTPNQVVIANITEFGISSDLSTDQAVKRLTQDETHWVFRSTNKRYSDIRIPKHSCTHPILGVMVGRLT